MVPHAQCLRRQMKHIPLGLLCIQQSGREQTVLFIPKGFLGFCLPSDRIMEGTPSVKVQPTKPCLYFISSQMVFSTSPSSAWVQGGSVPLYACIQSRHLPKAAPCGQPAHFSQSESCLLQSQHSLAQRKQRSARLPWWQIRSKRHLMHSLPFPCGHGLQMLHPATSLRCTHRVCF